MREDDDPAQARPARAARVREAGAAGLVGGHLEGRRAADELPAALAAAFEHDPLVIVEAMSHGMEVECSVLGNLDPEASVPGEIVIDADWYDYEAKYEPGGMELVVPARLPEETRERVRSLAVEVFLQVGCAGHGPLRLLRGGPRGRGRVLVNELNTIPGFTDTSVYAKLFEATRGALPRAAGPAAGPSRSSATSASAATVPAAEQGQLLDRRLVALGQLGDPDQVAAEVAPAGCPAGSRLRSPTLVSPAQPSPSP